MTAGESETDRGSGTADEPDADRGPESATDASTIGIDALGRHSVSLYVTTRERFAMKRPP